MPAALAWDPASQVLAGAPFVQWELNSLRAAALSFPALAGHPLHRPLLSQLSSSCVQAVAQSITGLAALQPQHQQARARALSDALALCVDLGVVHGAYTKGDNQHL